MKQILLSDGKTVCYVDDEDYPLLSRYTWHPHIGTTTIYALCASGVFTKHVLMHRLIMAPHGFQVVDHINGNGSDNRKENLRNCTTQENNRWRRISPGKHGYIGVKTYRWKGGEPRYYSYIGSGSAREHLGSFPTPKDAGIAYDNRAKEIYGKFARLNFPGQSLLPSRPTCPHGVVLKAGAKGTKHCSDCRKEWARKTKENR